MGIFDEIKRLIFTVRAEPVEQVPMRAVPQPEQAQSSNAEALIRFTSASEQLATVLQQSPQKVSFVFDGTSESSLGFAACRAAIYTDSLNLISALAERLSSIDDSIAIIYVSLFGLYKQSVTCARGIY